MNDDFDNARTDKEILDRIQAEAETRHPAYTLAELQAQHPGRRGCFFIPAEPWKKTGKWVPSWVVEDEPGHTPLAGNGPGAQPWFWGGSYLEAKEIADRANAEMGIPPGEAAGIILSSVRASRHAGRADEYTSRDAFGPKEPR